MTWFHVLLLDRAGNNLVNADFSPYFRMFFAVKHIYLTLYIAYMCRIAPIYSAPLYLLALLFTSSGPIGSSRSPYLRPCDRACSRACLRTCARAPASARVCAWACVCAALASVGCVISFAYIVDSPAVLPRARLAVNFFEIVFGLSISVQLSST